MAFIDLKDVTWCKKMVSNKYPVFVPMFMENVGWFHTWEKERFASMEAKLHPGMVFVDVGGYDGWQDAVIAHFVGGAKNMVVIEPEPTNWGNIKATFDANGLTAPDTTYQGFIGTEETSSPKVYSNAWPIEPDYSKLISHTTFRHIDENAHNTETISLDHLVATASLTPSAINVDVEGAGLLVLQSAEQTLREFHPILWVSIHGNELFHHRPLAKFPDERGIPEYLERLGYKGTLLANDHEEEWVFE